MTHPKTLTVINLWAGPGAGKSTTAAGLFNLMKNQGLRVEYVTEFAKDLTYQRDYGSLQNQLFVLAQQDMRLRRLVGQVDYAISDSPLPLGLAYTTPEYGLWFEEAVGGAFDRYTNVDVLVRRTKPYAGWGRNQTESQALALDIEIRGLWEDFRTDARSLEVAGDAKAPYAIARALGTIRPHCPVGDDCDHLPPLGGTCALCGRTAGTPPPDHSWGAPI